MKLQRIFFATSFLALAAPTLASSLTGNCNAPPAQVDIECLQPKLDSRMAQAEKLFRQILRSVDAQSREAPEAKIDSASVISELRIAEKQWKEFATHECAAARELVGIGTDKDRVELTCLIQLYDQRIRELKAWRGL